MKTLLNRLGNNRFLLTMIIILQIAILVLIFNPLSLIADSQQKQIINDVVNLSNDPDFRNASIVQITDADAFKKEYLLNEKFNELQNDDYFLAVNNKLIIYRKGENRIILESEAPASLLDITRLNNLIFSIAKDEKLINKDEQPALKIYNKEVDLEKYSDYFENLKNGDVLAFFPENKVVLVFNLQSNEILESRDFELK